MDDIEDLLAGGGGSPPGFRLPLTASVGVNPKYKKKNKTINTLSKSTSFLHDSVSSYDTTKIPGTEVSLYTQPNSSIPMCVCVCVYLGMLIYGIFIESLMFTIHMFS